jgi:metal transporter CNNM
MLNLRADLSYSQTGRAHLLLVSNTPGIAGGAIGVITLEGTSLFDYWIKRLCDDKRKRTHTDIIEEIISEEIVDETDQYEDNQSKRRAKRMTTAAVMRGCAVVSLTSC